MLPPMSVRISTIVAALSACLMLSAPAAFSQTPIQTKTQTQTPGSDPADDIATLPLIAVSAARLPSVAAGQSRVHLTPSDSPALRLDGVLATVPGVALFRRAGSLTANPTIQGVTLRGVGANAAGRVLVTLDGVPLNDPFGGWVYWSALAPDAFDSIEVLKGGSAGAYGAQALAGTIALITAPITRTGGYVAVDYGSFDSYRLAAGAHVKADQIAARLDVMRFDTDGPYSVDRAARGPVDVRAASDVDAVTLRLQATLSETLTAYTSLRYFEETRISGLALADNRTEAVDLSTRFLYQSETVGAELTLYYRSRDFENRFVSARDGRTAARPVLDQFDVPGEGFGLLARVQWDGLELGVDARHTSGGTAERFRNLGAGFTRRRDAGGDQWIIGSYVEASGKTDRLRWSASLRGDAYRVYGGGRTEVDLAAPDTVLLDQRFEAESDALLSGRVGADYHITPAITLSGAAYRTWRLPTVNEYYRPFRVVNDITEANAALAPETLWGVEATLTYQPLTPLRLSATYVRTWLENGVGNVTVGAGPAVFPVAGFVPAGGVLRRRDNIDLTVTDGVELNADLALSNGVTAYARYMFADVRVQDFAANPALEGLTPPQTPRHSAAAGLRYSSQYVTITADARYLSNAFNDDRNSQRLGALFLVNIGADVPLADWLTLYSRIENLFDRRVVANIPASGPETLAQPQFARIGLRADF